MIYYVYILESEVDGRFYIGQTQDIQARLKRHNKGYNQSTKAFCPWRLLKSIPLSSRSEATRLEKQLKSWKKREQIIRFLTSS